MKRCDWPLLGTVALWILSGTSCSYDYDKFSRAEAAGGDQSQGGALAQGGNGATLPLDATSGGQSQGGATAQDTAAGGSQPQNTDSTSQVSATGGNEAQGGTSFISGTSTIGGNQALGGTTAAPLTFPTGGESAQGGTTSALDIDGGLSTQGGTTTTAAGATSTGGTSTTMSSKPSCEQQSDCGPANQAVQCVDALCQCSGVKCLPGQKCRKHGSEYDCG